MTSPVIEAKGLIKRFGTATVLAGVDLAVSPGAVVGLVGRNGAGKTTLIKCLLGLLRITEGKAAIFGEDPWDLSAAAKARLGYVPQVPRLYPWMKASQVIAYTSAFYDEWDHAWTEDLVARWNIPLSQRVSKLSVGQAQQLALVLALGHRPELLILDEPVASLDPHARREFLRSLIQITGDGAHTILFSTHITSDLERVASHVAFMNQGRIAAYHDLDALKDSLKRLRIRSSRELPATLEIPGALRVEVRGHGALATVRDAAPQTLDALRVEWDADVAVEDLNLEEIFLEVCNV